MSFLRPTHVGGRGAEIATLITHLRSGAGRVVAGPNWAAGSIGISSGRARRSPRPRPPRGCRFSPPCANSWGLRLDPQRALVDVLVVDRIEKPTPDW